MSEDQVLLLLKNFEWNKILFLQLVESEDQILRKKPLHIHWYFNNWCPWGMYYFIVMDYFRDRWRYGLCHTFFCFLYLLFKLWPCLLWISVPAFLVWNVCLQSGSSYTKLQAFCRLKDLPKLTFTEKAVVVMLACQCCRYAVGQLLSHSHDSPYDRCQSSFSTMQLPYKTFLNILNSCRTKPRVWLYIGFCVFGKV